MFLSVKKTEHLDGQVMVPASKSHTIRAIIIALLSQGESRLINPLDSVDVQDAMRVCVELGAEIIVNVDKMVIRSSGLQASPDYINTGNSGLTTRLVLSLMGLRKNHHPIIVDCGEQMRARPIHHLVEALRVLGLRIQYLKQEGQLPVSLSGQITGGVVDIDGMSSQHVSSLLIALPLAFRDSEIRVHHLHDRPYVAMTLAWLTAQGIRYHHQLTDDVDIYFIPGNQHYHPIQACIAGDFSSASYLIAAAAMIPGRVELLGLDMQDPQGDKCLVPILQDMGADIVVMPSSLIIQGGQDLAGLTIDASAIPDLLPTLAVLGTYAKGKTQLIHVPQARLKETDRIHSMTQGLLRLGANIDELDDGMTIYHSSLHGALVNGYDDHRTVMALSIAGLLAHGVTVIDDSQAINKTFPGFISLMKTLGARIETRND